MQLHCDTASPAAQHHHLLPEILIYCRQTKTQQQHRKSWETVKQEDSNMDAHIDRCCSSFCSFVSVMVNMESLSLICSAVSDRDSTNFVPGLNVATAIFFFASSSDARFSYRKQEVHSDEDIQTLSCSYWSFHHWGEPSILGEESSILAICCRGDDALCLAAPPSLPLWVGGVVNSCYVCCIHYI